MAKPTAKAPRASTSALPKPSRKRQTQESDDEPTTAAPAIDSLGLGDAELAFGSDDEVEDDGEIASGQSGDEDEFPEIDDQEASEDDEEFESGDEDDDEEDSEDDEAALLAELEAEEGESNSSADGSDLDEFIRRHTVKPDERDAETIKHEGWEDDELLPGYMARSHKELSKITGQEKTVWDDEIDAGYGSDSSTEEASQQLHPEPIRIRIRTRAR